MSATKLDLATEVNKFRRSSAFTPGDPFSFSITLTEQIKLPGKFNPSSYLNGLSLPIPDRVAVICPGNGGLCVELLRRGAKEVVGFEPRNQYFTALTRISEFCRDALGRTFRVELRVPAAVEEQFDLILWPEGLEEIRDPLQPLYDTINALRSGGRLLIEVAHGPHGASPPRINSWRPGQQAFIDTVQINKDCKHTRTIKGRNASRVIHEIVSVADGDFFMPAQPGAEEAKVEPLDGSPVDDINYFSESLKKALLAATHVPAELLEPATKPVAERSDGGSKDLDQLIGPDSGIDPALLKTEIGTSAPAVEPSAATQEPPSDVQGEGAKGRRGRKRR